LHLKLVYLKTVAGGVAATQQLDKLSLAVVSAGISSSLKVLVLRYD
jgi:hypothetical protein